MFANFYMTPLDYYIKYTLGITLYGRYVDDFMMYGPKNLLLKSSKLKEISEDKFYFQPYTHGVKFIGSMIKPGRIYCGNRVRGELEKKLCQTLPNLKNLESYISSVNSYLGLIKHYS